MLREARHVSVQKCCAKRSTVGTMWPAQHYEALSDRLRGQGQGWVLLDSPRVSRVTVGPTRLHNTLKCCAKRGMGWSPTVPRDTRGESSRTQPWPWPLNFCKINTILWKNAKFVVGLGDSASARSLSCYLLFWKNMIPWPRSLLNVMQAVCML